MILTSPAAFPGWFTYEWWQFAVDVAIAAGTLLAVGAALWAARAARQDAAAQRELATKAQEETAAARAAALAADRQAQLNARATRQAVRISASAYWAAATEKFSVDTLDVTIDVSNLSDDPITEVKVFLGHPIGLQEADRSPIDETDRLNAGGSIQREGSSYAWQLDRSRPVDFIVEFTDALLDRWRLLPDKSLTLMEVRVTRELDVEEEARAIAAQKRVGD
jgi:hypothetical protein